MKRAVRSMEVEGVEPRFGSADLPQGELGYTGREQYRQGIEFWQQRERRPADNGEAASSALSCHHVL